MPRGRKRLVDDQVFAVGEVTCIDMSVSFGVGRIDRFGSTPWSEVIQIDVRCRLLDWNYKGVTELAISLHRERRFEDPLRIREFEEKPLDGIGLLETHKDILRAFSFVPPPIFDHVRAMLSTGRSVYVMIHMTRPVRRRAELRHLQFTTDRTEIE